MSTSCVCEAPSSTHIYEYEVARRWFALPPGVQLPLYNGGACQLVFAGHPGGAAGPDVQDAVLHFSANDGPVVGDIEFHVRASDWFVHQHQSDPRYNNVLLHVVLICDRIPPLLRQDGTCLPMCSLYDVAPTDRQPDPAWPCQNMLWRGSDEECSRHLQRAGLLRFEQKAHIFVEHIHQASPQASFSIYDACLIPAIAEGLGYGRNRAFFRAVGQYLLGQTRNVPEPLGHSDDPAPLDASRLSLLHQLVERWRTVGAWNVLRETIGSGAETRNAYLGPIPSQTRVPARGTPTMDDGSGTVTSSMVGVPLAGTLEALRAIFTGLGVARADILICNVILPFALAVALVENDAVLAEQAQRLYVEHPGLSSNRITRLMSRQLLLTREPHGACRQQGLHYIYQQTCREKRCEMCMLGERRI